MSGQINEKKAAGKEIKKKKKFKFCNKFKKSSLYECFKDLLKHSCNNMKFLKKIK